MTTVHLHVGTFKTGTSFLQTVLARSKEQLARDGVLWPGDGWTEQVMAARGLLTDRPAKAAAWVRLAGEVSSWDGRSAIISSETLSMATPAAVERAAASLADQHVRVVLTARDIGRVLPAQWQESVQTGKSWSYRDYLDGVVTGQAGDRAHDHFWRKHDWAAILRTWARVSRDVELVLVTVPPPGAPRPLLWQRFCAAVDLDSDAFDTDHIVNESLGAASAEVMRYVSAAVAAGQLSRDTSRVVKKTLAKSVLNPRRAQEPTLVLPAGLHGWARDRSEELIADLGDIPMTVVGDLDDLRPRFGARGHDETEDPSTLPVDQLLAAAGFGLAALCETLAENGLVPMGEGPDTRPPLGPGEQPRRA